MSPILIAVLESVVPMLVNQAEKLFPAPASGSDKHAWVQGMLNEMITLVATKFNLPSWANPITGEGEILLKNLIEKALDKIDP